MAPERQGRARVVRDVTEDADLVIVAYGISARLCREVVDRLRRDGIMAGMVRPITLWPFPYSAIPLNAKKIFVVELSAGQLVEDVELAVKGRAPVLLYGKPGGEFFSVDEICETIIR